MSFCVSILTYGSEVWGFTLKDNFDFWEKLSIEKVKFYSIANHSLVSTEKRRVVSWVDIDITIIIYWAHLNTLNENTVVKQAFLTSKNLYEMEYLFFSPMFKNYSIAKIQSPKSSLKIIVR